MKGKGEKIRKYRRLRRKAKNMKKEGSVFRFFLTKVIPLSIFQFYFKKYWWLTWILVLLSKVTEIMSSRLVSELEGKETELQLVKKDLKTSKKIIEQENLVIKSLQVDILNWHNKFNESVSKSEEKLKKLNEESNKIKRDSEQKDVIIKDLTIKLSSKENQLELKDVENEKLKKELKDQKIEFYDEISEIRNKLNQLTDEIQDIRTRTNLQLLYKFIEKIVNRVSK